MSGARPRAAGRGGTERGGSRIAACTSRSPALSRRRLLGFKLSYCGAVRPLLTTIPLPNSQTGEAAWRLRSASLAAPLTLVSTLPDPAGPVRSGQAQGSRVDDPGRRGRDECGDIPAPFWRSCPVAGRPGPPRRLSPRRGWNPACASAACPEWLGNAAPSLAAEAGGQRRQLLIQTSVACSPTSNHVPWPPLGCLSVDCRPGWSFSGSGPWLQVGPNELTSFPVHSPKLTSLAAQENPC